MTSRNYGYALGGAIFALIGVIIGAALGCRTGGATPPVEVGTGVPSLISCTAEIVRRDWARVYPAVMNCLTAPLESPMGCLDAVPAAIDVVACIVRNVGRTAASKATEAEDIVTLRKAERARAYIAGRGLKFTQETNE